MKKTLPLTLNGEIVGSVEVDTETLEMVATVEDERVIHRIFGYNRPFFREFSIYHEGDNIKNLDLDRI